MLSHFFKLIWNRKRKHSLMILGIVISFVALFLVMTTFIYHFDNYLKPLGFDYHDVLYLNLGWSNQSAEEIAETIRQIQFMLDSYPEVENYALSESFVFIPSATSMDDYRSSGEEITIHQLRGGDKFPETMGFDLISGRWFSNEDDVYTYQPIVVNQAAADALFPQEDPLGKIITDDSQTTAADGSVTITEHEYRIIGLIDDFRNGGELTGSKKRLFQRANLSGDIEWLDHSIGVFTRLMIRVKPGSDIMLEQRILREVENIAKDWTPTIGRLEDARRSANRESMIIPTILGIICGFLVINVALGLFGMIWYRTNQRMAEIGLRRALGSTIGNIRQLIIGESMVLTSFGMVIGLFFAVQFPMLGLIGFIGNGVYVTAMLASIIIMYLVTLLCALYPGNRAALVEPAIALHEE